MKSNLGNEKIPIPSRLGFVQILFGGFPMEYLGTMDLGNGTQKVLSRNVGTEPKGLSASKLESIKVGTVGENMKIFLRFFILGCLGYSGVGQAGILQLDGESREIEGVTISKGAEAQLSSNRYSLTTVGAGLRKKKVGIFSVKVYVAQLLASDPAKFVRSLDQALTSLDGIKAVALRMSFLRDVEVEKIRASYQESLVKNGVDLTKPEINTFLEAVEDGGPATARRDMIVAGHRLPDGSEQIVYENSAGQSVFINGTAGFVKSIFSIWLGQTTDSELEALRNLLITGH